MLGVMDNDEGERGDGPDGEEVLGGLAWSPLVS